MISLYARRRAVNLVASTLMFVATAIGLFFLAWILWTTLKLGLHAMHWDLFVKDTPAPGTDGYGLRNAFVGSLILMVIALAIGVPVGLMAGTWLAEYGGRSRRANVVRFVNDIMLSAPSIEIGLFTYAILVAPMGHFSGLSGGVALAILMIPIIVRTTDEMLRLVAGEMREAAIALGAPMWQVVTQVTWKAARAGILTGILIALARISGETAPLLFTAFGNNFMTVHPLDEMASLPIAIYQYTNDPSPALHSIAWAGALLITIFVLTLSLITRFLFSRKKVTYE